MRWRDLSIVTLAYRIEVCSKGLLFSCPGRLDRGFHFFSRILAQRIIVIKKEIGDKLFSVLIDESCDISIAEQMAVIVRLVTI